MNTKFLLIFALVFSLQIGHAQVGIGTTDPKSSLDIASSSLTNPTNTDGLLIPKIDNFPSTNPGADQDGMMVYVTGNGAPTKGFYYWDNGTSTWVSVVGIDTKNTLDGAYDEGGNGIGKNIVADNGSVRINGTDGFLVTGTFGSGNTMDSEITGSGTRMFFNPRKAAFRAGSVTANQWNDANIGDYSVAMGRSTTASNTYDVAIGFGSLSTGSYSTTLGWANRASGPYSVSIGQNSTASGWSSTALGRISSATGSESMVFGHNSSISGTRAIGIGNYLESPSGYEIALGNYNTLYTPASIGGINPSDRLFSIGNGTNNTLRSNALTIYKNGLMNINDAYNMPLTDGTNGQVMTSDGAGNVSFQTIVGDGTGTDNQNLTTATLTGTTLNLGIQNGAGTSVNLSSLQDGTGTDNQNLTTATLTGTTLNLGIQNGTGTSVNLASLQDGTGTDNQNLNSATLTGTTLNLGIQNGTGTSIDLSALQDGVGTDDQNIENLSLNGSNILTVGIENGTADTVDLSVLNQSAAVANNTTTITNHIANDADTIIGNEIITAAGLSGTTLQITEAGNITNVDLSTLQDGVGTDNQNLTPATLTGTTLNLGIQDGTGTSINLSSLQDGIGTDNQNLTAASLTGTTLNLGIQNGTGTSINLASLLDGNTQNTLDQAYDEGGIGNGRTINATDGALRINGDDGFLITGTAGSGNTIDSEITGAGTRMFFNPRKGAFRTGRIDANQWDDANIGFYSFAVGENTTASSSWDIAMGLGTTASGGGSIALGNDTVASGLLATAIGDQNIASGDRSLALGSVTTASGTSSIAMGSFTIASGNNTFALGTSITSASFSETSIGLFNTNYTPNSTTAFNASDRLFVVGNGTNAGNRSNALTIFKSGLMNINDAYNMPLSDGSAGQVMTTDGAGNVTFQDNYSGDFDWFEVGTTSPPNAINDDKYTNGHLSIGKNTTAFAKVDIETNNDLSSLLLVNNTNTGSNKNGILNVVNGTTSPIKHGLVNTFNNNANGILEVGVLNNIESRGSINLVGYSNFYTSTSNDNSGVFVGFQNTVGSQHQGSTIGLVNNFNTSSGINPITGVRNIINATGNGIQSGSYTEINSLGLGNKFGYNVNIPITTGGTHYGFYADVQSTTGYAGYFIGRTSLGSSATNRYQMPAADGSNGQVMTTDGSGNVTFQNPNTGTDNQQIDTFSFNTSTNELTLEIEDDGQPAQVVDLSSLNPQKAIARLFMSASQTETGSGLSKVNFDSAEFDIGNNFNTTTDDFIVPQTGIYRVTTQITMDASTGLGVFDVRIRINGAQQRRAEYNHTGSGQIVRQITSILSLTAGDTIDIAFSRPAIGATIQANSRASFFEIEQIQ